MQKASNHVPLQGVAFQGATDRYVAGLVTQELLRKSNPETLKFVYWLSLSTHLPVDRSYAKSLDGELITSQLPNSPKEIVYHEIILADMIREVARIASDPNLRPTRFLMVGDHPPPFVDPDLRGRYHPKAVPYISLRPF